MKGIVSTLDSGMEVQDDGTIIPGCFSPVKTFLSYLPRSQGPLKDLLKCVQDSILTHRTSLYSVHYIRRLSPYMPLYLEEEFKTQKNDVKGILREIQYCQWVKQLIVRGVSSSETRTDLKVHNHIKRTYQEDHCVMYVLNTCYSSSCTSSITSIPDHVEDNPLYVSRRVVTEVSVMNLVRKGYCQERLTRPQKISKSDGFCRSC